MKRGVSGTKGFMPQFRGSDGLWSDLWHKVITYDEADNIRRQLIRTGASSIDVRVERRVSHV